MRLRTALILVVAVVLVAIIVSAVGGMTAPSPDDAGPAPRGSGATSGEAQPLQPGEPIYYYPLTRYQDRITVRWFGKGVAHADRIGLPCGDLFHGFHTADDLEAFPEELDREVPVFAIADGTVRQVGAVNGYGGLVVIKHVLNGKPMTVYYGHIDLGQTKVEEGDTVTAGKLITFLGDHCSSETSFERKHLHFGIHNDPDIDVRGYVLTQEDLRAWLNPKEILSQLKATEPGD